MMVEDRYLYHPAAGKYTVDRYLDDLQTRYGGIDAVLVWPAYPNLGVDDRNLLDMVRSMPGGHLLSAALHPFLSATIGNRSTL